MPDDRDLFVLLSMGEPRIGRSSLVNFAGRGSNKQVVGLDESIILENASREIVSKFESVRVSSRILSELEEGLAPFLSRLLPISSLIEKILPFATKWRRLSAVNEQLDSRGGLRVRFATVLNKNF